MGISGLLPLLKHIQVNRHLSEFQGQAIAVDAYVWLHRGTYGCAPELAMGKKTNKYVDYAMHRVRLLRHHGIQPYIVFDGGPLPAKKRTENSRKQKREENFARANALVAQGKHSQARELYVRCIDVTPQMAYQLIKALRAEDVAYVVAPYEADAQMAYMERIGLVDGILTEDSDLLVFGCQRVLLKLDAAASCVTCIARADFAAVTDTSAGGISLAGWSDVQFRAMAILSGCDYLPNIPGVGLKTAWTLLRKYRSVENVVRALTLEGTKKVPKGYLEAFWLAEKVFLHQRVYDPTQERLVHLHDPPHDADWDDEQEAFVGANIEPSLAKQVAEGDACPISLLPMEDINPTYVPRALEPITMNSIGLSDKDRAKGRRKESEKPPAGGLLNFFTPKAKAAFTPKSCSQMKNVQTAKCSTMAVITAGQSSGKRTLAEVMEQDMVVKRKKHKEASDRSSKFFCEATPSPQSKSENTSHEEVRSVAGPSHLVYEVEDKENEPILDSDDVLVEASDPVQQEDGYISPSPSLTRCDTPDLSSPVRPRAAAQTHSANEDAGAVDDFGADVLSSPPVARSRARRLSCDIVDGRGRADAIGAGIVRRIPSLRVGGDEALGRPVDSGPDLRATFGEWDWDDVTSEIECSDASQHSVRSTSASSPGPVTPDDSAAPVYEDAVARCGEDGMDTDEMEDVIETQEAIAARNETVALGWWEKWARNGTRAPGSERKLAPLRRRETTMTPDGRQRPSQARPHFAQPSSNRKGVRHQDLRAAGRRSLVFMEEVKETPKSSLRHDASCARPGSAGSMKEEDITATAKNRLAEFRWTAAGR